ncbi:MAG: sensor histidine kinase [Campylobacterota bacterium]
MSKSTAIDLYASQKRTLVNFLVLYLSMSLLIITSLSFLYYGYKKEMMLLEQKDRLQEYSDRLLGGLKDLHVNLDKDRVYPRFIPFESAIYDASAKKIFSTIGEEGINLEKLLYLQDGRIFFINQPASYYLGAKYVVVSVKDSGAWLWEVYKDIAFFGGLGLGVLLGFGYFLLRLLLKPMRDVITLLDHFIKDTTHELSTPVSAVLTNVEMLQENGFDTKTQKKLTRIATAAKTIANLYEDLTYLTLHHKLQSYDEKLDIKALIRSRLEYFKTHLDSKRLALHTDLEDAAVVMDEKKFIRMFDNLLSNAIKYNVVGGYVKITCKPGVITVYDSGIGMDESKQKRIFERYLRLENAAGGFGIGLHLVAMIAKEYGITIEVDSKPDKYTQVRLLWQR